MKTFGIRLQSGLNRKGRYDVWSCNVLNLYKLWEKVEWWVCMLSCSIVSWRKWKECRDWQGRMLTHIFVYSSDMSNSLVILSYLMCEIVLQFHLHGASHVHPGSNPTSNLFSDQYESNVSNLSLDSKLVLTVSTSVWVTSVLHTGHFFVSGKSYPILFPNSSSSMWRYINQSLYTQTRWNLWKQLSMRMKSVLSENLASRASSSVSQNFSRQTEHLPFRLSL